MNDKDFIRQLANIPPPQPGFDTLGMSAPVLVQMNPDGRWENSPPEGLDQERLKAVVSHLVKTNAVRAAQSYCCQCAAGTAKDGGEAGNSSYVPVIMMPIYSVDECPFDMESQIDKVKKSDTTKHKKAQHKEGEPKETAIRAPKKRGFVMQRLTDFDLLSQW